MLLYWDNSIYAVAMLVSNFQQLYEALEKFPNKVRVEGGALAFIVVMSSVGFESGCGILMDDHREVGHDDIMCQFDEADELVGIPKAFLFNICVSSWKPKLSFHAGWVLCRITRETRYKALPYNVILPITYDVFGPFMSLSH